MVRPRYLFIAAVAALVPLALVPFGSRNARVPVGPSVVDHRPRTIRIEALPIRPRTGTPTDASEARRRVMRYHGGPVMTGPLQVHIVWYGSWARKTRRRSIITDFVSNLAGDRFAINATYPDASGKTVANSVSLGEQYFDPYSRGRGPLSDDNIERVVVDAISGSSLPAAGDAVYLVITSNDVRKDGFLTSYCGWHSYTPVGSTIIKYAFIGDPTGPNLRACAPQAVSPNRDGGADAMVSVIAHEIDEMVTDPEFDGWFDTARSENADRCAWTYGTTYRVGRARANLRLGRRHFLVQQNWVNEPTNAGCALRAMHKTG